MEIKDLISKTPLEQIAQMTPYDYTLQCAACEFRKHCQSPLAPINNIVVGKQLNSFSPYIANTQCDLMVVSEKPSFDEESCSNGWGDRHHRYIKSLIHQVFPNTTYRIHLTYLLKCFTGSETKLGVKNTSTCYNVWLKEEMKYYMPKRILALGKLPCKVLAPKSKFGEIVDSDVLGAFVGSWQSASYVLNAGQKHQKQFLKFLADLKG